MRPRTRRTPPNLLQVLLDFFLFQASGKILANLLFFSHLASGKHALDRGDSAAADDENATENRVNRQGLAEHDQTHEDGHGNFPVRNGAVVSSRQVAASHQQEAQSHRTADDPQKQGTDPVECGEVDVESPVLHAGVCTERVQDDGDNTSAQDGEDEVPHTTSRGVGVLTVAVEEHRSAVEEAGSQAEGVAETLLRELRRRRNQVEVYEEARLVANCARKQE